MLQVCCRQRTFVLGRTRGSWAETLLASWRLSFYLKALVPKMSGNRRGPCSFQLSPARNCKYGPVCSQVWSSDQRLGHIPPPLPFMSHDPGPASPGGTCLPAVPQSPRHLLQLFLLRGSELLSRGHSHLVTPDQSSSSVDIPWSP